MNYTVGIRICELEERLKHMRQMGSVYAYTEAGALQKQIDYLKCELEFYRKDPNRLVSSKL